MDRPALPAALEREVKIEAGYRCAVPACRQTPVEIAHIVPWAEVKEHTFDNLICLCPTCHSRYDRGEIDRQAMKHYKANLSLLNGRYIDIERRVLDLFAAQPEAQVIKLPGGFDIFVLNLLRDGFLVVVEQTEGKPLAEWPSSRTYALTSSGRTFIDRWLSAQELE
jgi:HNH endonuclease